MRHRNPTPLTGPFSLASQKIKFQTFLWTAILLLIVPSIVWAAQVTLAWNPNQTRPDGYRLYQRTQGQSYNFSRPVWSGTGTTATITNLNEGTQYFFVVRAFVGSRQSGNSNEAAFIAASANRAPTANAGTDQTVSPSSRVTLNGSASKDPDGGTLTYTWAQTAG
ncbi:MAG: fibronectin type III domain-containing protein, partial [Desulfatitalea sp.]|nr:fibronectin type III domain-containing protein [Desulfatitalea sp.]